MSPAKDRAFIAAIERFARSLRLNGSFSHSPPDLRHYLTEQQAHQEAFEMSRLGLASRHITNALNAVSNAILSC